MVHRPLPGNDPDKRRSVEWLDRDTLAKRYKCSPRHITRLADSGRLPRPIKLGALSRWNSQTIEDWEAAGCPNLRNAAKGGRK
tara:strand:+ start:8570 stop:8818 length:249 start_codon:yes stop_codon:yes gene_type:complete